jgi:hypothetical protein
MPLCFCKSPVRSCWYRFQSNGPDAVQLGLLLAPVHPHNLPIGGMTLSLGVRFASCTPAILFGATQECVGVGVGACAHSRWCLRCGWPVPPETDPGSRVGRAGRQFLNGLPRLSNGCWPLIVSRAPHWRRCIHQLSCILFAVREHRLSPQPSSTADPSCVSRTGCGAQRVCARSR